MISISKSNFYKGEKIMSEFRIGKASTGEVVVIDNRPANGKYDLNERVELRSGKTVTSPEAVSAALKQLGIPALKKGMSLSDLSSYVQNLQFAKVSINERDL